MLLTVLTDPGLCGQVADRLRRGGVPEPRRLPLLGQIDRIAGYRLARLLPSLLTDWQWTELVGQQNSATLDIYEWVRRQVPWYDELVRAIVLDITDEIEDI